MNCQHCEELFLDYIDEALSRAEEDDVRRHLATCDSCKHQVLQHQKTLDLFRTYRLEFEPSTATDMRILQAARDALQPLRLPSPEKKHPWWSLLLASPIFKPVMTFAVLLLMVGGVSLLQMSKPSSFKLGQSKYSAQDFPSPTLAPPKRKFKYPSFGKSSGEKTRPSLSTTKSKESAPLPKPRSIAMLPSSARPETNLPVAKETPQGTPEVSSFAARLPPPPARRLRPHRTTRIKGRFRRKSLWRNRRKRRRYKRRRYKRRRRAHRRVKLATASSHTTARRRPRHSDASKLDKSYRNRRGKIHRYRPSQHTRRKPRVATLHGLPGTSPNSGDFNNQPLGDSGVRKEREGTRSQRAGGDTYGAGRTKTILALPKSAPPQAGSNGRQDSKKPIPSKDERRSANKNLKSRVFIAKKHISDPSPNTKDGEGLPTDHGTISQPRKIHEEKSTRRFAPPPPKTPRKRTLAKETPPGNDAPSIHQKLRRKLRLLPPKLNLGKDSLSKNSRRVQSWQQNDLDDTKEEPLKKSKKKISSPHPQDTPADTSKTNTMDGTSPPPAAPAKAKRKNDPPPPPVAPAKAEKKNDPPHSQPQAQSGPNVLVKSKAYLRAELAYSQRRYRAALRAYKTALRGRLSPFARATAHYRLGHILLIQRRDTLANTELQRYLSLSPKNRKIRALYQIYTLYQRMYRHRAARKTLKQLLQLDPKNRDKYLRLLR